MRRLPRLIFFGLLLLGLAALSGWLGAFVIHNAQWVAVNLPELRPQLADPIGTLPLEAQLCWLVIGAAFAGFASAMVFVVFPAALKWAYVRHRDERLIASLEAELADLRRLQVLEPTPLEDLAAAEPPPREDEVEDDVDRALDLDGRDATPGPRR